MDQEFSTQNSNRALGLGLLFGISVIVLIYSIVGKLNFISKAEVAHGVIEELTAGSSHLEISFKSKSGQIYTFNQGGAIFGYQKGMQVEVYYLPEDPSISAELNDIGAIWFSSGLATLFSVTLLGYWIAAIIKVKRN
ncbi:TPA: DUF3592 domain-containing protein [Pseudomonas aeruginosa]